ncbi:hypothetical protein [Taibaiella soli]|uniref:Uncharacterized protein n=1 Tax=Taibaiella soli TaxID=1649169 RepID=A0A2W2BGC2_9BACT|nr:hypothetical protein [Taibaiella soli]PZF72546.1 hypothetical protein DN068_11825 [Taibaiella soli]
MENNMKEIRLGQGLGKLIFGMTRDQAKAILGAPSEKEKYSLSDDGDDTEAWHYDDLGLSLSFDQENEWKLTSIAVSSEDYKLEGEVLIGREMEEILDSISKKDWGEPEEDEEVAEESPEHRLLHIDEATLSLWFENGVLTELQWGPFYENESVKWPS